MKLLLKLAIAALLANAVFRVGSEYLTFIKFREDVREAAIFKSKTDAELRRRIQEAASRYDLPVSAEDPEIRRHERQITVIGNYTRKIEVVPTFFYPKVFSYDVDTQQSTAVVLLPPPPNPR